jgi:hypothetical protein
MSIHFGVILTFTFVCFAPQMGLAAVDCTPVKPNTGTDKTIEDNLKGHAEVILKSLGSGEIENGYKQTEADTLSKYPNADQLLLWRSYIYIACSLLQSSSQWNDDQKFEKLIQLIKLYNTPPPTEGAQNVEPRNTLTGQSHGFTIQARCVRSGMRVVCKATVVNEETNREVTFWLNRTKLYNGSSKAYQPAEATVAGVRGSGQDGIRVKLLQGHPAEAEFQFNLPPSDHELAELDIGMQIGFDLPFTLEVGGNVVLQ